MPLFFLGGAHGAGKSVLAAEVAAEIGARVLSASELIREEGAEPSTHDKRVTDIDSNQERLLRALERQRAIEARILLDGHYCLRSQSGAAVAIAFDIFARIAPNALLLLDADPSQIVERLRERDAVRYDAAAVEELVACEMSTAMTVSAQLRVPLGVVRAPDALQRAVSFLKSYGA
jgi:adenylate kinase